ncbi:MAG TPA: FAD-dependent monooxygenase [Dehalococcoidia bacterium]|nr:FAD-dependent monooxygenase [Dehalococcoidia bacterium]
MSPLGSGSGGASDADVIVVGAGPAGCAAAILLGRRGVRVTLIDRASFPRPKLCTHALMPAGLTVLERLGVLDAVEAAGAQRWYGVRLWLNGVPFAEPLPHARVANPYGLSLRRPALDALLLDAARQTAKVQVLEGVQVARLLHPDGQIGGAVVQARAGGPECAIVAPRVILAGGRHTRLVRGLAVRSYTLPNRHTAYVAYLSGVPEEPEPALEGFYWHGRSASLLPADGGLRVAGVMLPPGSWPPGSWSERLIPALRRFPPLRQRLADARIASPPIAVRGLRNVWRESATPGLLLIGDAGLQTDPLFGQGISWALRSGEWAAEEMLHRIECGAAQQRDGYRTRRARTFLHRFVGMSAFSALPPGSMLERLLIASAAGSPRITRLFLRLVLGFATVSRDEPPRRGLSTWLRESLRSA